MSGPRQPSSARAEIGRLGLLLALGVATAFLPGVGVLAVAAILIGVLGMAHGASDTALYVPGFTRRFGRGGFGVFLILYIGLAVVTGLFWAVAPVGALAGFLALSAWHFGTDDGQGMWQGDILMQRTEGIVRGLLPLTGPALFFEPEVARIFAALVPPDGAPGAVALAAILNVLAPLAVAGAVVSTATLILTGERRAGFSLLATLTVVTAFPPLIGFSLYFAFVHSARQVRKRMVRLRIPHLGGYLRASWIYMSGGIAVLVLAGVLSPSMEDAALRGLFIGLAAVTVPHILFERPWRLESSGHHQPASAQEASAPGEACAQH